MPNTTVIAIPKTTAWLINFNKRKESTGQWWCCFYSYDYRQLTEMSKPMLGKDIRNSSQNWYCSNNKEIWKCGSFLLFALFIHVYKQLWYRNYQRKGMRSISGTTNKWNHFFCFLKFALSNLSYLSRINGTPDYWNIQLVEQYFWSNVEYLVA